MQFIEKNWLKMIIVLCAVGVVADFIVYIFRWTPYKVWYSFLQRLRTKRLDAASPDQTEEPAEIRDVVSFRQRNTIEKKEIPAEGEEDDLKRWKEAEPAPESEEDDLSRWYCEEPAENDTQRPDEITKAGYAVPADSPYRRPETGRNRRRRFRINNLLGDAGEEEEFHYFSPPPIVDRKEAYHKPVYPEKWTGNRSQDS